MAQKKNGAAPTESARPGIRVASCDKRDRTRNEEFEPGGRRFDPCPLAVVADVAPHFLPIAAAVRAGLIDFALVERGAAFGRINRTALILLIDDLDPALGPAGFDRASLARLIGTVGAAVIALGVPTVAPYEAAADAAMLGFAVALIETRPQHSTSWLHLLGELAPRAPVLVATGRRGAP